MGCAFGACSGGLDFARGGGGEGSIIPGGGAIGCAVVCGACRRSPAFSSNHLGFWYSRTRRSCSGCGYLRSAGVYLSGVREFLDRDRWNRGWL